MNLSAFYEFSFSEQSFSRKMGFVTNVKLGDLDHDGLPDVFIGSDSFDTRSPGYLLEQDADGGFSILARVPARFTPREAVFADFDGDGLDDVYVANTGPDLFPTAPGEPDTLLLSSKGYAPAKVPGGKTAFSHGAAPGDVDRDGDIDLFVATNGSKGNAQPFMLVNGGRGDFTLDRDVLPRSVATQNRDDSPVRYQVAHLADVDGDGWDDLIVGKQEEPGGTSRVSRVFFSDMGRFDDSRAVDLPDHPKLKNAQEVLDIGSADLDGDGKDEIVVLSQGRRAKGGYTEEWAIQVFETGPGRTLTDVSRKYLGANSYSDDLLIPYFLEFADVNGDGWTDILPYQPGGGAATLETPVLLLNKGGEKLKTIRVGDVLPDEDQAFFFDGSTVPIARDGGVDFVSFSSDGKGAIDVSALRFDGTLPTYGSPPPAPVERTGTGAADKLRGGAGDDALNGRGGADVLTGRGGDDLLVGGGGDDKLFGGAGDDTLRGDRGADLLKGGGGDDKLLGGDKADALWGGRGHDDLFGGAGADTLRGEAGNDVLRGGGGNDRLFGGRGDDLLEGGKGADSLTGGAGRDVFLFARGDGKKDVIEDFDPVRDRIAFGDGADDASDVRVLDRGDDALVVFANVRVRLLDVDHHDIDADHFLF